MMLLAAGTRFILGRNLPQKNGLNNLVCCAWDVKSQLFGKAVESLGGRALLQVSDGGVGLLSSLPVHSLPPD